SSRPFFLLPIVVMAVDYINYVRLSVMLVSKLPASYSASHQKVIAIPTIACYTILPVVAYGTAHIFGVEPIL
ncbi:MAG: hypothetical protein J6U73_04220, partial [Alistipes sp.]|nr:hypothetical protein [Alistipes sp.]